MQESRKTKGLNVLISDNITPCDPLIADILIDCYNTIVEREEDQSKNKGSNYFELGLRRLIEEAFQNGFDVRERQSQAMFDAFNNLLKRKEHNTWIKPEKELYDKIQGLMFVKLFANEESITEILGSYTQSILRLDYSKSLPTFEIEGVKRNLYNYVGFLLESITDKIRENTISKKSVEAIFELHKDVLFIITDNRHNIRSINRFGENLFEICANEVEGKPIFSLIPELGAKELLLTSANTKIQESILIKTGKAGLRKVDLSIIKRECEDEITEFAYILNFNLNNQDVESNLHENYSLLTNVISGLHELRKENNDPVAIENSASLLENLYNLREKTKSQLLNNDLSSTLSTIDVDAIFKHICQEVKYLPNIDRVSLSVENKKSSPLFCDYELMLSILRNVVTNSIKFQDFSKSSTNISVCFEECPEGTRITIADNGIGIKKNHFEFIFEKGYKVNDTDGLGYGLYFVKRNATSLGGTVEVESKVQEGTTVTLLLPI